jgi:site-specific recombinase XerC
LYCDGIGKNLDELVELKVEGLSAIRASKEFQAERFLETFLTASSLTPNMESDTAENIEVPESKKRCPKTRDLIELENAFTTLRDKALLWFVSSAPFRIETITGLYWRDLKATNDQEIPY